MRSPLVGWPAAAAAERPLWLSALGTVTRIAIGAMPLSLRLAIAARLTGALLLASDGPLRPRLGPLVAMIAALTVGPAVGLEAVRETARLLLGLLGSGLEPLQFLGRLDEVFRKRSNVDLLTR